MEQYGVSPAKTDNLNWLSFFTANMIPVTLGNIVGGAVFVGIFYWIGYQYESNHQNSYSNTARNTTIASK